MAVTFVGVLRGLLSLLVGAGLCAAIWHMWGIAIAVILVAAGGAWLLTRREVPRRHPAQVSGPQAALMMVPLVMIPAGILTPSQPRWAGALVGVLVAVTMYVWLCWMEKK